MTTISILYENLFVFIFGLISTLILCKDVYGYLREVTLEVDHVKLTHIIGIKKSLKYEEIKSTSTEKTGGNVKYMGKSSNCVIIRTNKFPFRFIFIMNGFGKNQAIELQRKLAQNKKVEA